MKELNPEQKAFLEHQVRTGTAHEFVIRRQALRDSLIDNSVGHNRPAALRAIGQLTGMIDPPETDEAKQEKVTANFIAQAQKLSNAGNTHQAKELLAKVGLELDVLTRVQNIGVPQRSEEAKAEYKHRRTAEIEKLMTFRGLDKRRATLLFEGKPDTTGMPELSKQFAKGNPISGDSVLRSEINRKFEFDMNRPIQ